MIFKLIKLITYCVETGSVMTNCGAERRGRSITFSSCKSGLKLGFLRIKSSTRISASFKYSFSVFWINHFRFCGSTKVQTLMCDNISSISIPN